MIEKQLENQLEKHFGFNSFRQGQEDVISKIMNQQSVAAIFPTGAGKSICYQLPALLLPHLTLVVSPLLSLMKNQLDFLWEHNISAARLDSSLTAEKYNQILEKAKCGTLKILMISIERFKNERFRFHLQKMKISLLVIDEAHCISEWGHNFRPEYLKLPVYQKEFGINQILLLTATATKEVVDDMCCQFNLLRENVVSTGFYRDNLFIKITSISESKKREYLLSRIKETYKSPTIIYTTLQKTAEDIAGYLSLNGINASFYHAGMGNDDREETQNRFMGGSLDCVVATIAFGMGIDKNDIRNIFHYDLPKSLEGYSQEIGRSGRDGKKSLCELLGNRENIHILENFVYGDTPEPRAIWKFFCKLSEFKGDIWEIKPWALSYELDIKMLPLKTLFVYLDIEKIMSPQYTLFEMYAFKYNLSKSDIINQFSGERKKFVSVLFNHSNLKKVWAHVDIKGILKNYKTDRKRIITALDYFEGKGWIELKAKQITEVYKVTDQDFDIVKMAEKIYNLFKSKEKKEIRRIHDMVEFFEKESCISKNLAEYFGDNTCKKSCGHCSFCKQGSVVFHKNQKLQPLSSLNLEHLTQNFIKAAGKNFSETGLAKFFCGISTPVFMKIKAKTISHFGALEKYPFLEVKKWIDSKKNE